MAILTDLRRKFRLYLGTLLVLVTVPVCVVGHLMYYITAIQNRAMGGKGACAPDAKKFIEMI